MPQYNWANLSDYDFEMVCRDVMAVILARPVEAFTRGRDGGVDLRSYQGDDRVLGQAKHFHNSSFASLKTAIRSERAKLAVLDPQPTRYLLFTSTRMTPSRKTEVVNILKPYSSRGPSDVYGVEDIEGIIAGSPQIEEFHYKLWLASVRVIERILGNATLTRSRVRIQEITDRSRLFVPHNKLPEATKILRDEHCLIISGPPGIGKTTMSEMISIRLVAIDYHISFVATVEDLERAIDNDDSKQLFVYDDFLGRTNLREAPSASSQERLFSLMRWMQRHSGKYLILTTREYLYREAKAANERLLESRADLMKCLLDIDGYDRTTRARILYNHLYWTSGIRWIADTLNRLVPASNATELGDAEWI